MTKEEKVLHEIAKDLALDILKKRKSPDHKITWDRQNCVRKLSSVLNLSYEDTASKFDLAVNHHIRLNRSTLL
jgi:hypothetical protein